MNHAIEMTHLTQQAAAWPKTFDLDPWYRCTSCGLISSVEPTSECKGPRKP